MPLQRVPSSSTIGTVRARFPCPHAKPTILKHWRDRAAQMRALALETEAAILMRDLAADYEKLAERAAFRANGKSRDRVATGARRCRFAAVPIDRKCACLDPKRKAPHDAQG